MILFASGIRFNILARVYNLHLSFKEWFGLTSATMLYTQIMPAKLGAVPRAMYLKKKYGFHYADYITLLIGLNIIDLWVNSLSGVGLSYFSLSSPEEKISYLLYVCTTALGIVALGTVVLIIMMSFDIKTPWGRLNQLIVKFKSSISVYRKNPKLVFSLIIFLVCAICVRSLSLWVCFWSIGLSPDAHVMLLASCLTQLTMVISFTPANIGITEGVVVAVTSLFGVELHHSLPALVVSRFGSLSVQIIIGLVCSFSLFGGVKKVKEEMAREEI